MQFLFRDHLLDTDRRELSREQVPIAVEPQVFDLVVHLMQNRDRVVSKDELIDKIWHGRSVSESTLTSRINAARKAIGDSGTLLVGRCEAYLWGITDLKLVIDRLTAYADAGADCLYAPGLKSREDIAAVVKAVHPKPFNLLIGGSGLSLQEARDLGVRRISVGGSLARAAWGGFMRAAKEMAEKGTFTELASGYPGGELNKIFSQ